MFPPHDERFSVHDVPDVDFLALWDDLTRAREGLAEEAAVLDVEHFAVTVRGGHWTLLNTGMPYDTYRGFAKSVSAKEYCRDMNWSQSSSYAVSLFTEAGADAMAHWWCAKNGSCPCHLERMEGCRGR